MSPGYTSIDNDSVIDRLPVIPSPAVKVLLSLSRRANGARECWPSVERIAGDTGLCIRAVRRALSELIRLGFLVIDKRPGRSTIYRLLTPDIGCTPASKVGTSDESTPLTPDERGGGTSDESTPLPSDVPQNKNQEQEPSNKNQGTRPKARGKTAAGVEIPSELAGDDFKEAWERWLAYRRKRRLSCLPECLEGQLKKLAALGPSGAVEELGNAITNTWQSVCYKPGGNSNARRSSPTGPGQVHDPNATGKWE